VTLPDLQTLDGALRATEILLGLAMVQQSAEHLTARRDERLIFAARGVLALILVSGAAPIWAGLGLLVLVGVTLAQFGGPYNGGSDRIGILTLICLTLAHILPDGAASEVAFGYLGLQVVLSYFLSGWVKIVNRDWRSGKALCDVFAFSAYPVSEGLRALARQPRLLFCGAWAVMVFELMFPLALFTPVTLMLALSIAVLFHLANAFLFGLNRFVWFWFATYPSLIWFQHRFIGG
jgi:hypothetical protein